MPCIIVVVYFYPRLRIRHPKFILVDIIVVSEARYKTLHSKSHRKLSEWVSVMGTASSNESEGRGFKSRLVFFLHTFSYHCLDIAQKFKTTSRHKVYTLHAANFVCLFGLMLYVHGQQRRSCREGQLSYPHCSPASLPEAGNQYLAHILSPLTDNCSS